MSRRAWTLLVILASMWGGSYLLIKVCLNDGVPPAAVVFLRVALAAVALLPIALARGAFTSLRGRALRLIPVSVLSVSAPFLLITYGEEHLPSALTGILVATTPIFTFLLAFAFRGAHRASAQSLAGVSVGIVGVALLLGVETGGSDALIGGLMVVLGSLSYGLGSWTLNRTLPDVDPVGVVTGTMAVSALMMLPLVLTDMPSSGDFELDSTVAIAVLGVACTGAAFVIFFHLIASEGPAPSSLVAYVAPAFSVVYGVTILDESFTVATGAGLVLIVGGSWLAAEGRLPWRPRGYARAAS